VTDPTESVANHAPYPRLMWEFTDSRLGETWSRPIITRVKLRATTGTGDRCGVNNGDGDCVEQWVAIFGAGYRAEGDPNLSTQYTNDPNAPAYTEKGRGVYIVRIADGTVLAHIRQIQGNAIFDKMRFAIPAEPAVLDTNFDGFADVVYIGDLGGRLWKWDLSAWASGERRRADLGLAADVIFERRRPRSQVASPTTTASSERPRPASTTRSRSRSRAASAPTWATSARRIRAIGRPDRPVRRQQPVLGGEGPGADRRERSVRSSGHGGARPVRPATRR
jgi:Tfp pilus tip-associated adhesin PilY1